MKRILLLTGAGIGLAAIAALAILYLPVERTRMQAYAAATDEAQDEPRETDAISATDGGSEAILSMEKTHEHDFAPATCEKPETCRVCGETRGKPLGHDFAKATCTESETCRVCGITRGEPLGHDFLPATYESPATCTRCGITQYIFLN